MKKLVMAIALLSTSAQAGETIVLDHKTPGCVDDEGAIWADAHHLVHMIGTPDAEGCYWVKKGTKLTIVQRGEGYKEGLGIATVLVKGKKVYIQEDDLFISTHR